MNCLVNLGLTASKRISWHTVSHARLVSSATANKLYELRIYKVRPINLRKTVEISPKPLAVRVQHSPLLGYFFSEVGGLNESIHVWEYDSYAHRAQVRKNLAADPQWVELSAPMVSLFESQHNCSLRLLPWSQLRTSFPAGGTYFLYKFDFRQSESEESVSQAVQQFVSDADLDTVGCWRPEIGDGSMRRVYGLFHSPDMDSSKNPALASAQAWQALSSRLDNVHGRLLSAAPWSALK